MSDIPKRPRVVPISRGGGGGGSKLRGLRCFAEFDRRLRLGWASTALVKMIQEEYQELTELSPTYLKKLIDQYRATIPAAELSAISANSQISRAATKALANGIDELEQLQKLYDIQLERINIDFENEKKIGKLLSGTGREVFVAMKLLRQSAELKMDLGLIKRSIGTMEITGQLAAEAGDRYGNEAVGKVIADPDARRKVLGIAQRLLALGAKASIDAVEMIEQTTKDPKEIIDVTPSDDDGEDGNLLPENPAP